MADGVGILVSCGQKLDDVLNYTLRQLTALVELEKNRSADRIQEAMVATRVAYHADKDQYTKFGKEIEDGRQ